MISSRFLFFVLVLLCLNQNSIVLGEVEANECVATDGEGNCANPDATNVAEESAETPEEAVESPVESEIETDDAVEEDDDDEDEETVEEEEVVTKSVPADTGSEEETPEVAEAEEEIEEVEEAVEKEAEPAQKIEEAVEEVKEKVEEKVEEVKEKVEEIKEEEEEVEEVKEEVEEVKEEVEEVKEEEVEEVKEEEVEEVKEEVEEVEEAKEEDAVAVEDPTCPSRAHVTKCAAKYLDSNGNGLLERSELQGAIDALPWWSRGILNILGSVDKMMVKCDIDGDDAIGIDYDMSNNGEQCLATCFKRRAFKAAFFPDCDV